MTKARQCNPCDLCRKCNNPRADHRAAILAHHSECTLEEFEPKNRVAER
jgi:hypothetical protein